VNFSIGIVLARGAGIISRGAAHCKTLISLTVAVVGVSPRVPQARRVLCLEATARPLGNRLGARWYASPAYAPARPNHARHAHGCEARRLYAARFATMSKARKWEGEATFARSPGNDGVAPIAEVPGADLERGSSTLCGHSHRSRFLHLCLMRGKLECCSWRELDG
jgi:hypothetical protein